MRTQPNVEMSFQSTTPNGSTLQADYKKQRLLVEGLGVGGGGRNVGVTGSLVRAGGELELVGSLEVGIAGGAVGGGVILKGQYREKAYK
jgi:hypothetical protein